MSMSEPRADEVEDSANTSGSPTWRLTRRGFLIGMGATGTAFALGVPLGLPIARRKIVEAMAHGSAWHGEELNPLLWIEMLPDDRIRLFLPKAEMGQGTHTGLAQIAAEELEVAWEKLEVVHASTRQGEAKYRGTYGSMSISTLYEPLRRAAATMREMLRTEAARRLNVSVEKLTASAGYFEVADDPKSRISYGALVGKDTKWQIPKQAPALKPAADLKLIGKPMPRVDGRAKVTGRAVFGHDVRVDEMLYGAVIRPPTFEAKMLSVEPGKAAGMPGVVRVVIEEGFAGVVAKSRAEAWAARDAIAATWDQGHLWQQPELEELVRRRAKGANIQRQGDAAAVLADSTSLTAEYRTGLVTHACLETQAGLAVVDASGGKVWASTPGREPHGPPSRQDPRRRRRAGRSSRPTWAAALVARRATTTCPPPRRRPPGCRAPWASPCTSRGIAAKRCATATCGR